MRGSVQAATQHIHSIKRIGERIEALNSELSRLIPTTSTDSLPLALVTQYEALRGVLVAQDEPEMLEARVPPPAASAPHVPSASREAVLARTPRSGPAQQPSEAAASQWAGGPVTAETEARAHAATEPPTAAVADNPTTPAATEQAAAAEPEAAAAAAATVAGEPAMAEAADSVAEAAETSAAAEVPGAEAHSAGALSAGGAPSSSRGALDAAAPQSRMLGSPQQPLPQSARGGADDQRLPRRSRRAPAPASLAAPAETPEPQAHAAATPQAPTSQAATSQAATSVIGEQPDNDDDSCAVCQEPEGFEDNPIVFCDGCNVGCHKECYGLSELPAGDWYCDRCKQSRSRQPSCPACPSREGVFKRTLGGRWGGLAHVACALYLPGCGFLPEGTMDKAAGFDLIPKNRGSLKCTLCPTIEAGRSGFKIQCSHKKCAVAFHVTCAQRAQLHMAIEDDGTDGTSMVTYCKKHTAENKAKSSVTAGSKATKGKKPRKRKRR